MRRKCGLSFVYFQLILCNQHFLMTKRLSYFKKMDKTKFREFLWITWAGRPRPYFRTSSAPNSPFMAWFGAVNEHGNVCTSDSRKSVCVPNEDRGCAWNWNSFFFSSKSGFYSCQFQYKIISVHFACHNKTIVVGFWYLGFRFCHFWFDKFLKRINFMLFYV